MSLKLILKSSTLFKIKGFDTDSSVLIIDISRKALGLKEKKTSNSTFVQKNALRYRFMKRYLRVLLKQGRDYN